MLKLLNQGKQITEQEVNKTSERHAERRTSSRSVVELRRLLERRNADFHAPNS